MLVKMLKVLAVLAGLVVAAPVVAQSTPPGQPVGPGMMWNGRGMMWGGNQPGNYGYGPGMMGYGMMQGCPMMGAMMTGGDYQRSASAWLDGQLAYIHSELAITEAQEPVWKDYAAAVKSRSDRMLAAHRNLMGAIWQGGLPFDQAYNLHIEVMQSHLDAMKATRDAALKLYGTLTPDQQKKAAWVLPQSMCMM